MRRECKNLDRVFGDCGHISTNCCYKSQLIESYRCHVPNSYGMQGSPNVLMIRKLLCERKSLSEQYEHDQKMILDKTVEVLPNFSKTIYSIVEVRPIINHYSQWGTREGDPILPMLAGSDNLALSENLSLVSSFKLGKVTK